MVGSLSIPIVAVPQIEVGDDRIGAEDARCRLTPRAGAILRVLLREPARAWRVTDLAEAANASLGHVSNVRKALLDREWVEIRDDGLVLAQPDALLKSWRENYRQPAGHHIRGYTVLHGDQLRNRLSGSLNPGPQPPRAICAANSAAEWIAPYVRGGTQSFYADEPGARILQEALQLTHAAQGANVIVCIPNDETLFEDAVDGKTGARMVPLSGAAVSVLSALLRPEDNPWVIVSRKPGAHLTDLQHPWRRIRARADLDDVRIHDLRQVLRVPRPGPRREPAHDREAPRSHPGPDHGALCAPGQ